VVNKIGIQEAFDWHDHPVKWLYLRQSTTFGNWNTCQGNLLKHWTHKPRVYLSLSQQTAENT